MNVSFMDVLCANYGFWYMCKIWINVQDLDKCVIFGQIKNKNDSEIIIQFLELIGKN